MSCQESYNSKAIAQYFVLNPPLPNLKKNKKKVDWCQHSQNNKLKDRVHIVYTVFQNKRNRDLKS